MKVMNLEYVTDFTVFPEHINFVGTLFGGVLLGKMDIAAATLARKILYDTDADGAVTASMDKVDFMCPGHIGDLITIKSTLKSLGKSSILIQCKVYREDRKGVITKMCTAIFTFVAIKEEKPIPHNLSFQTLSDKIDPVVTSTVV
jgi:acyl-CoA hydrolase